MPRTRREILEDIGILVAGCAIGGFLTPPIANLFADEHKLSTSIRFERASATASDPELYTYFAKLENTGDFPEEEIAVVVEVQHSHPEDGAPANDAPAQPAEIYSYGYSASNSVTYSEVSIDKKNAYSSDIFDIFDITLARLVPGDWIEFRFEYGQPVVFVQIDGRSLETGFSSIKML